MSDTLESMLGPPLLRETLQGVVVVDGQQRIRYLNPAAERMFGHTLPAAEGQPLELLLPERARERHRRDVDRFARGGEVARRMAERTEIHGLRADGGEFPAEASVTRVALADGEYLVAIVNDLTERKELEAQRLQLAYYDSLTGLPNRPHLEEHLLQALRSDSGRNALILLDLDRFKILNDTLGHEAGDELLQQAGERLRACLPKAGFLARLGGDEFACFLNPLVDRAEVEYLAEDFLAALHRPFEVRGHSFSVSASLGICLVPDDAETVSVLMQHADTAMFEAKRAGGNQFRFFSRGLSEAAADRFFLEKGMREALAAGQVTTHFQPVCDLGSGAVVGAEALARWWSPEEGWISPGRFIPVAEETGLIHELGDQVLDQALARFRGWQEAGYRLDRIAVNLSPLQLESASLPERIRSLLERHGVAPERLELEVTEEAALREEAQVLKRIQELKELGVEIVLDDFGTGFSSPAYLKRFPASRMKIDRSFITNIDADLDNQTILRSLSALAEGFGFGVIAEGVETEAEAAFLREEGCEEVQGFLFGAPCAAAEFSATFL